MRRSLRLIAPLFAVALAGCVTKVALPQRQALDMVVGMDQAQLTAELGAPTAVTQAADGTVVLYRWQSETLHPGDAAPQDNPQLTLRQHIAYSDQKCDTRFRIVAGRVAGWSVHGTDCVHAPYPYLGNLQRRAIAADARAGRTLETPFLANARTGESLVLSGEYQSQ